MRLHRFFLEGEFRAELALSDKNLLHQWRNVFRYKRGDQVILFGDGKDHTYQITDLDAKSVSLKEIEVVESLLQEKSITCYMALIKKDMFELTLQKVVELGISEIRPIISERSEKKTLNMERARKIIIEAAEQSGWGTVPKLYEPESLENAAGRFTSEKIIIFDTSTNEEPLPKAHHGFCIGPEGGWSERERALFKKEGVAIRSLGKQTLRAETAAIIAAGLFTL